LQERLGVSWATLKRDLAYMRDRLNAPIGFDRNLGGYRFEKAGQRVGAHYELPGLWFSAEEIHALLTMHHLLSNLDTGGLLGPQIRPLLARLTGLLGSADNPAEEVQRRIRIQTVGARELHLDHFQSVGSALLRRKRLLIRYHARGTDEVTEREVSPQRLNHHRGNWYLDAWCHLRDGLRAFSVDAIEHAEILDTRALDVADERLDEVLGSGYGVFSGERIAWAVLRFTPERARWVASERWHGDQEGAFLADGRYELRVPYADDRELIMDIMKYGSDCEVVGPEALRARVAAGFAAALARYGRKTQDVNSMSYSWGSNLVGVRGFEPPTPASRTQCSTRLSYTPIIDQLESSAEMHPIIGERARPVPAWRHAEYGTELRCRFEQLGGLVTDDLQIAQCSSTSAS
jgi:predicted DNA-binding transcriptional regulator YafY